MSKLYKKYKLLKENNSDKLYLFECGIFYIFIHTDAIIMSQFLNLKLTNLNNNIVKCGFPIKYSKKYFDLLANSNYQIEIIPSDRLSNSIILNTYNSNKVYYHVINKLTSLNIDELSISQAFDILHTLQDEAKNLNVGE